MSFVRLECPWPLIEPKRGVFDWRRADYIFRAARRHGVKILPLLLYTPSWAGVGDTQFGSSLQLNQNAPNPFQRSTTIGFRIGVAAHVTIRLFDLAGRQVLTILDEDRPAGAQSVWVDGTRAPPGLYYYQLTVGGHTRARKLLLVR